MATVRCPDCGEALPVPAGARPGAVIECPHCAGLFLRLREERGRWTGTVAPTVSCPGCERAILLPEGVRAGDHVECCGQRYRLTFEYGTFAAEPPGEPQ